MRFKVLREILAIGLILLSLEGAYRVYKLWRYGIVDYPDVLAVGYFEHNPRYGMVLRKNFSSETIPAKIRNDPALKVSFGSRYTTNSLGFRGPEVSVPKPAGTFRVVVLGESTSLGMEMDDEQTWPARLEAGLNADPAFLRARGAGRVEVINASAGAWRTREGLLQLNENVRPLEPDLVLVAFNWTDGIQGAGGLDPDKVNPFRKPWWRHSKIIENLWIRSLIAKDADAGHQEMARKKLQPDEPWARVCVRNLAAMHAAAREMGAEMVLVDLPGLCRPGVEPGSDEFRAVVERTRVTPANYPVWVDLKLVMSALFKEVSRAEGIRVADVRSRFDSFTGKERLDLFTDEEHLSRRGAQQVAAAMRQALTEPSS